MDLKQTLEKMLSANRFFNSKTTDGADGRNPFENDYSRIVLSSYVRRMQDKAQVFPLAQNDFVRTRLTHSLEVSCFAKGLGLGVETFMLNRGLLDEQFPVVVKGISFVDQSLQFGFAVGSFEFFL